MNTAASMSIGLLIIIGVGGLVYYQTRQMPVPEQNKETNTTGEQGGNTQPSAGITTAAVAMHSDASNCWSIINGNVYDLTSWIPKHPGGEKAILQLCGKDGSAKFNKQHGGASIQEKVLAGFKIGALTQ